MDRLRELLEAVLYERRISMSALAREAGLQPSVLSRWMDTREGYTSRPSTENLEKLAPVVGRSYQDLLRMVGYLPAESSEKRPKRDDSLIQITEEVRRTLRERGWPEVYWPSVMRAALTLVQNAPQVPAPEPERIPVAEAPAEAPRSISNARGRRISKAPAATNPPAEGLDGEITPLLQPVTDALAELPLAS